MPGRKVKVDPAIMNELLEKPEIAKQVKAMNPETLRAFKQLLVSEGFYQRYVEEQSE